MKPHVQTHRTGAFQLLNTRRCALNGKPLSREKANISLEAANKRFVQLKTKPKNMKKKSVTAPFFPRPL